MLCNIQHRPIKPTPSASAPILLSMQLTNHRFSICDMDLITAYNCFWALSYFAKRLRISLPKLSVSDASLRGVWPSLSATWGLAPLWMIDNSVNFPKYTRKYHHETVYEIMYEENFHQISLGLIIKCNIYHGIVTNQIHGQL